jgi:hypothetical protein
MEGDHRFQEKKPRPPPPATHSTLNQEQVNLISQWITEGAGLNMIAMSRVLCDSSKH